MTQTRIFAHYTAISPNTIHRVTRTKSSTKSFISLARVFADEVSDSNSLPNLPQKTPDPTGVQYVRVAANVLYQFPHHCPEIPANHLPSLTTVRHLHQLVILALQMSLSTAPTEILRSMNHSRTDRIHFHISGGGQ